MLTREKLAEEMGSKNGMKEEGNQFFGLTDAEVK